MRIAAQVPFLDPRTLVDLGGGGGGDELSSQVEGVSRRGFYARLPLTASRLVREQLRLDDDVKEFEAFAEKQWRAQSALDLAILPDDGVAKRMRDIQLLLERTGTVMLTAASSTLGAHLALKTMLERVAPLDAERLAQSLTSGIRDVESARPGIGIMHVAGLARRESAAREAIERESTTGLDALPEGATKRALQAFLELYGERAVREAELSTPRWKEDSRPVLRMLRAALRASDGAVEGTLARAKAHADDEMARLLPGLNVLQQTVLRHLVARVQRAARLRGERMRAWVTRVLGMLRDAALDADRRLLRRDSELDADWRALVASGSGLASVQSVFLLTVGRRSSALSGSRGGTSRRSCAPVAPSWRGIRRGPIRRRRSSAPLPRVCSRRRGATSCAACPPAQGSSRAGRASCCERTRWTSSARARFSSRAHHRCRLDAPLPGGRGSRYRARRAAVARGGRGARVRRPERRQRGRRHAGDPHGGRAPRRRRPRRGRAREGVGPAGEVGRARRGRRDGRGDRRARGG